jgi:hypothetical protein
MTLDRNDWAKMNVHNPVAVDDDRHRAMSFHLRTGHPDPWQ